MTRAYYNEIDPAAAAVLRELVLRDVIPPGDVDTRSIKEVTPENPIKQPVNVLQIEIADFSRTS